ncbi:metallo-beta-lactamase family protein [Keratinibaculum paraultunense]|uniref:Metallo-beta-lactamase family protein n=1 Tax=Keratinibaculum paraultunense TaxID=1278232 RepID=A0A4R3KZA0_9FIRM|nr:MBL fold metallo-hydrolase [Keratinibaculum paraultunense]MBU5455431.1 MBL fold metallo-hydrolase [Caproiciproducens sp. MSJ-32]QQY80406.1 MBL fold metallo-hydrolase [Keratinibaculum paraultunense]TCS91119.1 metallo-beta-lactamase family protein [Keratinibaculum paraultunense]
MDIQFFGAAKMVTGSNHLIKTDKYNILIDCGMFQGSSEIERLNYEDFPYDPRDIDYLILTHAHIDHSGRIPKLVKDGFKGKIITTKPTYDLCKIMLKDSAKIQEADVEWENRKRQRAGKEFIEPLYTIEEAEISLKFFETYLYNQRIKINDDILLKFRDAGHMLGSAIIELWIKENGQYVKLVFSGDLGMPDRPIINDPEYIDSADYLIIESTYGNRVHEKFKESAEKLVDIINRTVVKGGTVIIPSFAVGRTQEIIYELNKHYEYNNNIEEYMKIPIYVDSPMAVLATEAFQANSSSFNEEAKKLILKGDNPFIFPNLRYIKDQKESIALNKYKFPKVIISSSGMATGGRVRHHLKHNLWDEKNSLVFVGYQAEGTLGRIILNGAKKVKILGEEVAVKAEIYDLQGFSGHADQLMLMDWIRKFKTKPQKIFIVHGEEDASEVFAQLIEKEFNIETIIPNLGDKYSIKKETVEFTERELIESHALKSDILEELEDIYLQLQSLNRRKFQLVDPKLLEKNYDTIKNILIDLQQNLMDLNIILGK